MAGKAASPSDADLVNHPKTLAKTLAKVRSQGYASVTGQRDSVNALAVPIKSKDLIFGALSLRYFASALRPATAVERYLSPLQQCAKDTAETLRQT